MKDLPNTGPALEEPIRHGGNLDEARRRFPNTPEPWIDLSTGINPVPYPFTPPAAEVWTRLPERTNEQALISAAAHRYGVAEFETVALAPGTQALIQLIPRLRPPTCVAVLGPTYDEHRVCWRRQGHEIRVVHHLDECAEANVVVIVNPNNPTGRLILPGDLHILAETLAAKGGLLVVDEAFVDVLPREASLCGRLPPATIVLRSFGKTYGLAGLRLGFAVAKPSLAGRIMSELGPWAVSGAALRIGAEALANDVWLRATIARLDRNCARLDALLASTGFEHLGGTPLFRLVRHNDASAIAERLGKHGIHVRSFAQEPNWLRFGLPGDEPAWRRLAAALQWQDL